AVAVLAVSLVVVRQEKGGKEQAGEGRKQVEEERKQKYREGIAAPEAKTEAPKREKKALEGGAQANNNMRMGLAFNEYRSANLAGARALLDECPEDLRRWEWHYLNRLCATSDARPDRAAFWWPPGDYRGSALSPNGKLYAMVQTDALHLF